MAPQTGSDIPFVKLHGLGNDYVYLDERQTVIDDPPRWATILSDRNTGIGGDGLIILRREDGYPCRMEMYNADGSRAEMCGNGIRCVARLAWERGYADEKLFQVATDSGPLQVELLGSDSKRGDGGAIGSEVQVRVDMGLPVFEELDVELEASGETFRGTIVQLGNPHFVIEVETPPTNIDVPRFGLLLECHPRFPQRSNIEFVHVRDRTNIDFRVWERGSGETRACGTGATAAAAALHHLGRIDAQSTVHLLGGDLHIGIDETGHTTMTGPAAESFRGTFPRSMVQ